MDLITVESSMLHAVGYDPAHEELEVVFNSGRTYRYIGVPRDVYEGLLRADSIGRYMHAYIIDMYPNYQVSRRR